MSAINNAFLHSRSSISPRSRVSSSPSGELKKFVKTLTDDATWGQEREVTLERVQNKSFGISIVGGKVI